MYTLGDIPRCGALLFPDNIAVVFEENRYTYKEFNERINRFANFLIKSGCKKGDGLAVMADNCAKYLEVYFAAAKIGVCVTPINVRLGDDEIVFIVNDSELDSVVALFLVLMFCKFSAFHRIIIAKVPFVCFDGARWIGIAAQGSVEFDGVLSCRTGWVEGEISDRWRIYVDDRLGLICAASLIFYAEADKVFATVVIGMGDFFSGGIGPIPKRPEVTFYESFSIIAVFRSKCYFFFLIRLRWAPLKFGMRRFIDYY